MSENERRYECFKLHWMLNNGVGLKDVILALEQYCYEKYPGKMKGIDLFDLFEEFEMDGKFYHLDGKMYPCYDKWRDFWREFRC